MNQLETIFSGVLSTSWELSWVILAVMLVRLLLLRRISARLLFMAWIVVSLGLLIPFRVSVRWSPLNLNQPMRALNETVVRSVQPPPASAPETIIAGTRASIPKASILAMENVFALLWLSAVVGLLAVRAIVSWNFRRRLRRSSEATDARLRTIMQRQIDDLGLHSRPALLISDAVSEPVFFGLFRPSLIFPPEFAERLNDDELRVVVLHEFGHWKRRDLLAQTLMQCARMIHWFNPLVWLAARLARLDCELACDEFVLQHTAPAEKNFYGATLLKVLGVVHRQNRWPAVLGILEHKRDLKRRIRMIADYRRISPARTVAGFMLLALLVLTCATRQVWAQPTLEPPANTTVPSSSPVAQTASGKPTGSIPLSDATYMVLVVDCSGSMRDPQADQEWPAVVAKIDEIIQAAPQLQFFQVFDADGRRMLAGPEFPDPWVPNRPEKVAAAKQIIQTSRTDNNSNPVPGLLRAFSVIADFHDPQLRFGIWILGDEISTRESNQAMIERLDQLYPADVNGRRHIAISAVAFPTWGSAPKPGNTYLRYIALMSELAERSGGTFIAVPSLGTNSDTAKAQGTADFVTPTPMPVARSAEMEERLAQERAYQAEHAKRLKAKAAVQAEFDQRIATLDPAAAFEARIEAAEQLAAAAEFQAAVRLYNRAMEVKPLDLPTPEKARQLQAALRAQSTPVDVTFKSDGITWVTIENDSYHHLSRIDTTTIKIPPGDYEVVGRRTGYEEVRSQLRVRNGTPLPVVTISCGELLRLAGKN